jgi:hypothetical protein
MKNQIHTNGGGPLRRALPALALAVFFGTSPGFADYYHESVQSGNWSDSATWDSYGIPDATKYIHINAGHTVTLGEGQSVNQADMGLYVAGHVVMEAESSYSGAIIEVLYSEVDGEVVPASLTLGSGATVNLTGSDKIPHFMGMVEMAAGSHISTTGIVGWQNLVFNNNGQDGANAWISAPMIGMLDLNYILAETGMAEEEFPDYTGPWYNIELNGFAEGTWSLISGISMLVSPSTEEGPVDLSLLELITLSGDSMANAKAELGLGLDEITDTYTLYVTISTAAVPEPAGYAALAGLALLAWVTMRRSRDVRR